MAEGLALESVVQRHRQRTTHQAVAAHRTVKARQPAHFEDLPDTVSLLTQRPAERLLELHFAAGVGAIAEFVFQPLKANGITGAVGQ